LKEEQLIRFLNNRSTPKERKEVLDWLEQPGAEKKLEEMMVDQWDNNPIHASQNEARYRKLLEKIHKATIGEEKPKKAWKINRRLVEIGRMAATYLLLLFSAYILYQSWKPVNPELLSEEVPVQRIERKTAAGEKLRITLPDQSKVIVNSLSTISFDSNFGKTDRVIQLEGEAYFEIIPDQDRPFKVQTSEVMTTALGTSFNAYSRNGQVAISLTEGKVKVSHKINKVELNPGEMAELKDNSGEGLRLGTFDPDRTTAWKEGEIRFKSKAFGEILATLEEWYGVTIAVQNNINQRRKVSGTFDNESLEDILNGLSFSMGLEHKINGKNVTIQPRPPMK
jgi:ferric-dicitrate binding protein FerR (iron transport regulator)